METLLSVMSGLWMTPHLRLIHMDASSERWYISCGSHTATYRLVVVLQNHTNKLGSNISFICLLIECLLFSETTIVLILGNINKIESTLL